METWMIYKYFLLYFFHFFSDFNIFCINRIGGKNDLQLAKKHHPDMNKDDPDAEKKFQEINKAYEVSFQLLQSGKN